MNKHKHHDLILEWLNGKPIQIKNFKNEWKDWDTKLSPAWNPDREYRIKPREFKEGAWYPLIDCNDVKYVCQYRYPAQGGCPVFEGSSVCLHEEDCKWVGEELQISWAKEG